MDLTIDSMQVSKGDVAPPFSLKDQDGKVVSLSKFKGKPVVLYFYPADETPGCTKQVNLSSAFSLSLKQWSVCLLYMYETQCKHTI